MAYHAKRYLKYLIDTIPWCSTSHLDERIDTAGMGVLDPQLGELCEG